MRPVHLLIVEVPQVRVETSLAGDVSRGVTADVPLSDHVRLVARVLHILGEDLSDKSNRGVIVCRENETWSEYSFRCDACVG